MVHKRHAQPRIYRWNPLNADSAEYVCERQSFAVEGATGVPSQFRRFPPTFVLVRRSHRVAAAEYFTRRRKGRGGGEKDVRSTRSRIELLLGAAGDTATMQARGIGATAKPRQLFAAAAHRPATV
jgi:hypothetical protein